MSSLFDRVHSIPAIQRLERLYWTSGIADDVPAMVYFLAVSLAPFALGVTALTALLFGDERQAVDVGSDIAAFMPDSIRGDVMRMIANIRDQSLQLLLIAVAAMLWTSSGAIGVLERALARFTGSRRHTPFTGKLRNLALGGLLALLVIAGLVAGSAAAGLFGAEGSAVRLRVFGVVFACVLATTIFRLVIRDPLSWRAAAAGGCFSGVCAQAVPVLIGLYVEQVPGKGDPGRVFLTLAVIVFGCWLLAHGLLFGAAIAAVTERRTRASADLHVTENMPFPSDTLTAGCYERFDGKRIIVEEVVRRPGRPPLVVWTAGDGLHATPLPEFREMVSVNGRLVPRHSRCARNTAPEPRTQAC